MTGSAARRPGPRVDVDVPALLVSVAEQMFAENGIGSVSLRAVARAAGVAPAAVTYHFADKSALVAAVVSRREGTVGDAVRASLQRLVAAPGPIGARDLVEALVGPFVAVIEDDPVGGLHWMKIFSRLALTDDPVFHSALEREPNVNDLFDTASRRALPGDVYHAQRVGLAVYSMITALAGADLIGYGRPLGDDGHLDPGFVEQLTLFTAAGLGLAAPA